MSGHHHEGELGPMFGGDLSDGPIVVDGLGHRHYLIPIRLFLRRQGIEPVAGRTTVLSIYLNLSEFLKD
jgi:hypothetical protein